MTKNSRPVSPYDDLRLDFDPVWFNAPPERSHEYFPTFARVSIAVQTIMRKIMGARFLTDLERFRDTRKTYPLLVYVASRPFSGHPRTEFTYDIINKASMRKFYYSVSQNLPPILASVGQRLRSNGMSDVALNYRSERSNKIISTVSSLRICRRRMEALLVCESFMVNCLLWFAGSSSLPAKSQSKIAEACEKIWLSRLRRLCPGCASIGPIALEAATKALQQNADSDTAGVEVPNEAQPDETA